MKNLPSVIVTGLDKQSAEDFKIILDDTGATTEVRVITAKG